MDFWPPELCKSALVGLFSLYMSSCVSVMWEGGGEGVHQCPCHGQGRASCVLSLCSAPLSLTEPGASMTDSKPQRSFCLQAFSAGGLQAFIGSSRRFLHGYRDPNSSPQSCTTVPLNCLVTSLPQVSAVLSHQSCRSSSSRREPMLP